MIGTAEAAERLGKTRADVGLMLRNGILKGEKIDGKWQVDEEDIRRLLGNSADSPPVEAEGPEAPAILENVLPVPGQSALEVDTAEYKAAVFSNDSIEVWWGTLPNAPIQNAPVPGHTIPRSTDEVDHSPTRLKTNRVPVAGAIVTVKQDDLNRILDYIDQHVVRTHDTGGHLKLTTRRSYVALQNDVPLATCLYIIPTTAIANDPEWQINWRRQIPPSLAEHPIER